MKKYFFTLLLLFSLAVQAQPSSTELEELLGDDILSFCDASLAVYDLDADSLLFSHRADKLTRPASVLKLITAVAALERLGCDYTIDTYLLAKEGNLYVKGAFDPLFSYNDMQTMLSSVTGSCRVDTLFADCSFMDSLYWGAGWAWDDTPYEFQPYMSPLMLCGGCVRVSVKPAGKGEHPIVECFPPSAFYSVENEAVSGGSGGLTVLRDWLEGTNVIRLRGNCTVAKSTVMNMFPSQNYFLTVATETLAADGVAVGSVAFATAPSGCDTLCAVHRTLKSVVREALMESNNLCAEAMLYHLGAMYGKRPVSSGMGAKMVKGFLDNSLNMPAMYDVCDGSGLSPYTLVSANILLQVLEYAYSRPEIYGILIDGLPCSGISGTLKNRTKGTAAYKKIFAKTGTVTGVCTLAGYAKASNGHTLAFVILNDGSPKARPVRVWQDRVCEALCR